jgi:hypothetical protein
MFADHIVWLRVWRARRSGREGAVCVCVYVCVCVFYLEADISAPVSEEEKEYKNNSNE